MKKKIKRYIEVIIPLRKRCKDCGKRVTNHHFFCDKCWGRRAKRKFWTEKINQLKRRKNHGME